MKAQFRLIAPVLFMTFAIFSVVNAQVLDEFTAVVDGHNVVLEWSNNAENDVTKYCIQRSFDGRNYYTIHNRRELIQNLSVNHREDSKGHKKHWCN